MKLILIYIFISTIFINSQTNNFELNQYMLAEQYEQIGDFSKAIEILEQLYQRQSHNQNYFNKLYNLYLLTKRYETAIRLIEHQQSKNPEDLTYYGLLGSVYYLMGNINLAKEKWEIPIKKDPSNPHIYKMMANYAIERRAFEIAIEYLIAGKNKSSDKTIFSLELSELFFITMQYESAIKQLCELLLKNPEMYSLVENRIFVYLNNPDVIIDAIKIVDKYQNQGISFKNLLAKLYTESKEFTKAFDLYKEIEKLQPTEGQQLLNYAYFLTNENEIFLAQKVFEYIYNTTENRHFKAAAKLGLAKTLESNLWSEFYKSNDVWKKYYKTKYFLEAETKKAVESFEKIIELYKHSDLAIESLYSLGRIKSHIDNQTHKAESIFNEIISNYPTSRFYGKSLLELALLKIKSNDLSEAEKLLKKLESTLIPFNDENWTALFYLTKLYTLKGDFSLASENLRKITDYTKNDLTNDALEYSLLFNTSQNDSLNLIKFTESEILIIQQKFYEAQINFDEILKNSHSLVLSQFAKLKSAEMDIALNNYSSAKKKLVEIYNIKGKSIFSDKALYLKAKISEYGLNDPLKAIEYHQILLMEFPNSIYVNESREELKRLNNKIIKKDKNAKV